MRLVALAMMLGFSVSDCAAFAQDTESCKQLSNDVQPGCREFLFELADQEMNAAYASALQRMQSHDQDRVVDVYEKALRDAQQAWLASRDPHCQFEALIYRDGSGFGQIFWPCRTRITLERVEYLRNQLDRFPSIE